jgi:hypothetical protein
MPQHDYNIANQSAAQLRADLNNALAAIVSNNSGAAEPSVTYAYQPWADTTTGLLKIRNAANNGWLTVGSLADTGLGLLSRSGGSLTGPLLTAAGGAAAPAVAFDGDTDTGLFRKAANQLGVAAGGVERGWFDVNGWNGPVIGSITASSLNGDQLGGSRNCIINGAMAIDQRAGGSAVTFTAGNDLAYCVDRWYGYCVGSGTVAGQQVQGANAGLFRYRFTGGAGNNGIGFGQRIESANSAHLAGKTVTLSVDLANSALTVVSWNAYYAATTDTFGTLASPSRVAIAGGTFTVNGTVSRYSAQISIPAAATTGIEILFTVGAQTSGTWTIGNVQLEPGNVATPFERRHAALELALCQRYAALNLLAYQQGYIGSGTNLGVSVTLPVRMRATPTLIETSTSNSNVGSSILSSSGLQSVFVYAAGINVGPATLSSVFRATAEL